MPTQTGSIDFKSTGGFSSYASGQYSTKTDLNTEIALRKGTYATCTTAADTAAKVATITPAVTGYALYAGATVTVRFQYGNTVANLTLDVNSTGAKEVVVNGTADPLAKHVKWGAYATCTFVYDGTYWRFAGSDQEVVRVSTAETAIEQNAESIKISAKKVETIDGNMLYDVDTDSLTKVHGPANRYFSDSGNSSFMVCDIRAIADAPAAGIEYMAHWSVSGSTANKQRGLCFYSGNYIQFVAGQQYTLSCWVRCTSGKFLFLHNAYNNAFPASSGARTIDSAEDSGWQFVTTTVTATRTQLDRVYFMARTLEDSLAFECDMCGFKMTVAAYATQAELKVANDAISSKVSTNDYNGNTIASMINQDATTVQIAASKVQIDGTAVFNAIKSSADAAYDANGAAATVQTNLDNLEIGGRNYAKTRFEAFPVGKSETRQSGVTATITGPSTFTLNGTATTTDWFFSASNVFGGLTLQVGTYKLWYTSPNVNVRVGVGSGGSTWFAAGTHCTKDNPFTLNITTEQAYYFTPYAGIGDSYDNQEVRLMVERASKPTDWTPAPEDQEAAINSARTWYAECPTAAATAAKVATITPATTAFKLEKGVSVSVKFTYANTVASPTLNVNGTGPIAIMRYGSTAPSTSAATSWQANSVNTLTYDGSNWRLNNWLNDNTTYNLGRNLHATAIKVLEAVASGLLMVGTSSGYKKIAAGITFSLGYPILYSSAAYTANTSYTNTYETWNSVTYSNTAAIQSGASGKTIYLKGSVSGNTFTIDSSDVFTTVVPTSEDNSFYIPLGVMSSATVGNFATSSTLYAYVDGKFRQATPTEIVATHRVYYRTATADSSLDAPTSWVAEATGNVYDAWTTKVPPLAASTSEGQTKYFYLYTCEQRKRLDGTIECTKVLLDENTTVIDGGNIITNSVTANKLDASSINASKVLTVGAMTDDAASAILNSNVQVGGRNLLLGTSEAKQLTTTTSDTNKVAYYTLSDYGYSFVHGPNAAAVMVSFDWETTGISGVIRVQTNASPWSSMLLVTVSSDSQSGHAEGIMAVPSTWATTTFNGFGIRLDNVGGTTTVSNFKMEAGNKATDWSPAPEDVTSSINAVSDAVGEATNGINGTISGLSQSIEDTNTRLARLTQSVQDADADRAKWIRADDNGLTIGASGSSYKLSLDNNSVDFLVGDEMVATASTEAFIPTALRLGDYVLSGSGGYLFIDYSPLA